MLASLAITSALYMYTAMIAGSNTNIRPITLNGYKGILMKLPHLTPRAADFRELHPKAANANRWADSSKER